MIECPSCGITHASRKESTAMHEASRSVRAWLKERVSLYFVPVQAGKIKKAESAVKNPVVWVKPGRKEFI